MESERDKSFGKFFVPALIIAIFAVSLSVPMLSVVTVDIAKTFLGNTNQVSLGAVTQINTVNRIAEVGFALVMGFLTVKFKSKPLLLVGVLFLAVAAAGSYFAQSLPLLQTFYIFEGGGTVIVTITAYSLVGELLTTKQKPKVVSYMNAVGFVSLLIATPAISVITNVGGWKLNFLWLILPLSVAGLVLAYFGLPSKINQQKNLLKSPLYSGFKEVFRNKSAISCLMVGMCGTVGNFSILTLAFYRQQFLNDLPNADQVNIASGVFMVAAALFVAASLITGRLINSVGAVKLTVIGVSGNSVFALLLFSMPNLWAAVSMDMLHVWFMAMGTTPWMYLTLDQVPSFRGTMMSLRTIFLSVGAALATIIGGITLTLTGSYPAVGAALALAILPSVPLTYFLTKDPNRTP